MGRVKCRPRVPQPDPEPLPPAGIVHVTSNTNEPDNSHDVASTITESSSSDIDHQAASDLMVMRLSIPPVVAEESLEPEASIMVELALLANNTPTCPQCTLIFPNMGIQDFREHVESCTRPTTASSDTSDDSLSPPPQSLSGDEELDSLTPYHLTRFNFYPESKPDRNREESAEGQHKMPQITEAAKFISSFEGMEEMDYGTLYKRTANAQKALVAWQDEWMDLDTFLKAREPAPTAKEPKNPRVPKAGLIGIGYQDQIEACVYGYEHNTHHKAVGLQDPLGQRLLTNGSNGGRELRQRVPTQKAAEADMSTTPDSEDEGGRRRVRGRKAREETAGVDAGGSRISRLRNESRLNSESRDPTPMKTFMPAKAAGRPRKHIAAARLQELHPIAQTLATTELWDSNVGFNAAESRPMTSSSATTGVSTDDTRIQPLRVSTRSRKRQNTSDFEDALPYNKRIGKSLKPAKLTDSSGLGGAISQSDGNAPRKEIGEPSANGEILPGMISLHTGAEAPGSKNKREKGKANSGKGKGLKVSGVGGSPSTLTNTASMKDGPGASSQDVSPRKDVKEGPKPSRASLNMRRRWAAKKKAEALGLPVPKIGRYPKGEVVTSTQNAVGPAEQSNSRKRKRDDVETVNADTDEGTAGIDPSLPVKRRAGRQKKVVKAEPETNVVSNLDELAADVDVVNPVPIQNSTEPGESGIPIEQKKAGKPKKMAPEVGSSTLNKPEAVAEDLRDGMTSNQPLILSSDTSEEEDAITPPALLELDRPSIGEQNAVVESHEQAPQPRTSGRIRRQTSAALSSQAGTRPSSRQKQTVTPTPAPTQQLVEEPKVKEEKSAAAILPGKRKHQPDSANLEMNSRTPSVPRDSVDELEPPPKRKKPGRKPKVLRPDSAPPTIIGSVEIESAQEQPIVKRRGGRPKKIVIEDTPGTEATTDGRVTPKEISGVKKRGQPVKDLKNGIASIPVVLPGVVLDGNVAVRAPIIRFKKIVRTDPILPPGRTQSGSTNVQARSVDPSAKNPRGGLRLNRDRPHTPKSAAEESATDAQPSASESEDEVPDKVAVEKATMESTKLSKSAKMSAAMKARWQNGSMKAVMAKKKAANEARRALKAQQEGGSSEAHPLPAPASAPAKRKIAAPVEEPVRATKRRRNMAATMDGAAESDSESDISPVTSSRRSMADRLQSEYERFQELSSPSSPPNRRQRRPAALRASQSFSMFRDTNGDDENDLADNSSDEEDEETEIKKQFDSEYDHFQAALASPSDAPGILTGKRKRKPVMNLEEAMRIEASEDDEDFEGI